VPRRPNALARLGDALTAIGAWPGRAASWLVLLIVAAVLASIIGSQLHLSELAVWGVRLPLLGSHLSITGLAELQWHLFAVLVMLGGCYALREDSHIRVDLVYGHLSPRWRRVIDILGDVVFLIPFCLLMVWLSLNFVRMAYISGEESDYGGLVDRYLIKAIIPVGFGLLALTAAGRVIGNLGRLLGGSDDRGRSPE
jgi:TRAP-type mannitol/chloroaromatic compound transport system permease small subunit